MKTLIKLIVLLLPACIILLYATSCHKCKAGCDTIISVDGAALKMSDTIVSLSKAQAITTISIEAVVSKHDGDRNCKYENKITCESDSLQLSKLSLFCNKDLMLNGTLIPYNTDLLGIPDLVQYSSDPTQKLPFVVLQTTPAFPAGRYHFLLQGSTSGGKNIQYIQAITWQ